MPLSITPTAIVEEPNTQQSKPPCLGPIHIDRRGLIAQHVPGPALCSRDRRPGRWRKLHDPVR